LARQISSAVRCSGDCWDSAVVLLIKVIKEMDFATLLRLSYHLNNLVVIQKRRLDMTQLYMAVLFTC
jgi:hypothetical protein